MQALSVSLECTGWSETQLSGCNMASLLELLVHQHSQVTHRPPHSSPNHVPLPNHMQGPYKAYRHNQVDPNPLLAMTKQRRHEECKCTTTLWIHHTLNTMYACTHTFLHTADAVECNDTDAVKRVKLAEKAFGTNPPTLEKFTFKVREAEKWSVISLTETMFFLKLTDGDSASCKVKLCGSSVLEGVKQCISLDYLTLPLPPCVATMHSFASNSVTVEDTSISSSASIDNREV